jgi:hypothetical protein
VGLAVDEDFELGAGAGSSSLRIRSVVYPRVGRQRHEFEFVKGSAETAVKINLHRFSLAVSPNGNDPFDCGVDADWLDENAITDLHTVRRRQQYKCDIGACARSCSLTRQLRTENK